MAMKKQNSLIVGLAPGLHGANATGLPFNGDFAGRFLKQNLDANGFRLPKRREFRSYKLLHYECSKMFPTIKSSATI